MKHFTAIVVCLLGSSALHAQSAVLPPGAYSGFLVDRGNQAFVESHLDPFRRNDTEAQREARLQKAIALRAEAAQLLIADGGEMTRQHQAYIRRKANRILND